RRRHPHARYCADFARRGAGGVSVWFVGFERAGTLPAAGAAALDPAGRTRLLARRGGRGVAPRARLFRRRAWLARRRRRRRAGHAWASARRIGLGRHSVVSVLRARLPGFLTRHAGKHTGPGADGGTAAARVVAVSNLAALVRVAPARQRLRGER